jgi:hypothetical protein
MMPARRFPIKHRRRNANRSTSNFSCAPLNLLLKAIETERDNLSRAESLLGCLTIAMEYGEGTHKGPYYPDVVQIAREMVRKSIGALDPINLPKPSHGKVLEEFCAKDCAPPVAAVREVPLLPRPAFTEFPRQCPLRIHYRNYFRSSARNAPSRDSASANISG